MLAWLVNKLWPLVEPRIEQLIRAAVDEAIKDLTAVADQHVQNVEDTIVGALKRMPFIGGLI